MSSSRTELPILQPTSQCALITFTTGSTGTPKAAIRTHELLNAQFNALQKETGPNSNDICMTTLPIVLLINLGVGCTSIIAHFNSKKPDQLNAHSLLNNLKVMQVNRLIASPYFFEQLAGEQSKRKIILPHLTQLFTGGAPVFPKLAQSIMESFPMADLQIVYGSTEAEPISLINGKTLISIPDIQSGLCVGKPSQETQVRIISISNNPVVLKDHHSLNQLTLKTGEIGEIIVSGQHVLRHYLQHPTAENRFKILDKTQYWHRTGDSGFFDHDGNLFLTGPCSSLIARDQSYLSPFLFENQLSQFPGIRIGTVLLRQQRLHLLLESSSPPSLAFLSSRFPDIDHFHFISRIPRDPRHHSKIDYARLAKELDDILENKR